MKRSIFLIPLLVLLMGMVSLAWADPILVGPGQTYTTIQDAISAAENGDEIQVAAGTYNEALQINVAKQLTIIGAGSDDTIIQPAAGSHAINITVTTAQSLSLQNIKLNVSGSAVGIEALVELSSSALSLTNVVINYGGNGRGIRYGLSPDLGSTGNSITISNSQINRVNANGTGDDRGLLFNGDNCTLTVTNSTITAGHYAIVMNGALFTANITGSNLTGYSALNLWTNGSTGNHSVVNVSSSTLTGRTFWSPVSNTYGTIAFPGHFTTVNVTNSTITNEWVGSATSFEALVCAYDDSEENVLKLDSATQLINTNPVYAPLIILPNVADFKWYIDDVLQENPVEPDWFVNSSIGSDSYSGEYPADSFATIQHAIDAANDGDVIHVANGTYPVTSELGITKSLTIIGESEAGTIIDRSTGNGYGLDIRANDFTMRNFTILPNSDTNYGYTIKASFDHTQHQPHENLTLEHITINGSKKTAFDIHGYNNVVLNNLTATNTVNGVGVALTGCDGVTLTGVETSGNAWAGVAAFVSVSDYLNRGSNDVNIDYTQNSIADASALFYSQDEDGLVNTNINVTGYTYGIGGGGFFSYTMLDLPTALAAAANPVAFVWAAGDPILNYYVGPGMSIQAAVNAATAGDIINVAPGLYQEDVLINKNLSLLGAKSSTPRNTGSSTDWTTSTTAAWDNAAAVTAGESVIRSVNTTTIQSVIEIAENCNVVLKGFVIEARNRTDGTNRNLVYVPGKDTVIQNVAIENNIIGPITGVDQDGTKGRMGISLDSQNGALNGLSGSVKNNKILGAEGNGNNIFVIGSHYNPSFSDYSGMTIENNDVYGTNRVNVELCGGLRGITVQNNYIDHAGYIWNGTEYVMSAASIAAPAKLNYGTGITMIRTGTIVNVALDTQNRLEDITISNNTIMNSQKMGIYSEAMIDDIIVDQNTISGSGWRGIWLDESGTFNAPKANAPAYGYTGDIAITGNSLTANATGILVTGKPPYFNCEMNTIANNTTGMTQEDGPDQTWDYAAAATQNWWGDATGPSHSTNPFGVGNAVSDNVLFDPWFADEGMNIMDSNAPVENVTRNLFYNSIQAAVNAANDNDVIRVDAGVYDETVTIGRPLSLIGPNADISAVTGTRVVPEAVIQQYIYIYNPVVGVSNVKIAGFEFSETDAWHSIIMIQGQTENVQILNNRFIDVPKHAIYTEAPAGGTNLNMVISGNMISGVTGTNASGMFLIHHTGGSVSNNRIEDTAYGGILVNGYCHGMTISNNQIYNVPQQGLQLAGDVANVIVSGNTIDFANTDNVSDKGGIRLYASAFTGPVLITGNTISNSFNGIAVRDGNGTLSPEQEAWIQIRDNDLSQNSNCGVYMPSGSTGNLDALENWWGSPSGPTLRNGVGVTANVLFDPWYIDDADGGYETLSEDVDLYVDATDELIKDNELQNYTVYVAEIADLLGFTVQVKVPIADFNEPVPTDFTIGPLFGSDDYQPFITSSQDATHYIFNVSIANLQNEFAGGVDGIDVALFSFNLTSITDHDNVPAGCWIEIPLDDIILRNHFNQNIPCDTATGFHVIIDATEPELTPLGETPGLTLLIDPVKTTANGFASVVDTFLGLTFNDNYNLDYLKFKILPSSEDAPEVPADFALNIAIDISADEWINAAWQIPDAILNYAENNLPTGDYMIWLLAVDDATNFAIWSWNFLIDKTPLEPPVWDSTIPCRTTARQNNSIDLKWANPAGTVKNHIWVKSYASLPDATGYPEYANASDYTIPTAPNPYSVTEQGGWNQYILPIDPPAAGAVYPLAITERGYYYITVFAQDASGNISAAPVGTYYRESISYWPGDVPAVITGTVTSDDINVLSLAWGKTSADAAWEATHRYCDVGPSTDFARRSRPMPDDLIDIEDLMMFAMNYANTDYLWYPRTFPEAEPVTIALHAQTTGDRLTLSLELGGNTGFVKGLDIPIAYGNGLHFLGFEAGAVWPESSLLLHTNSEGVVTLSGATLGADPIVEGNGVIATLSFAITGPNAGFALEHMVARTHDNREIEVVNNPAGNVDNDDLINVIPEANYLGKNYPNPFSGGTTIQYGLKEAGSVKLSVYNTRGQLIRTLVNESKGAGTFQVNWNGRDASGQKVSAGVYFFRLETSEGVQTAKGLMIK